MKKILIKTNCYENQKILIENLLAAFRQKIKSGSVRLLETHISWIVLAGRYAYKIKKAVNLEFLDFTTLSARKFCCEEEIRLNRRLAPAIYLDVMSIGGSVQNPLPEELPAIEFAVRMRRFPSTRLMDRMAVRRALLPQHIDRLASLLASFHRSVPVVSQKVKWGGVFGLLAAVEQNFEQMQQLLADSGELAALGRLHELSLREFRRCKHAIGQRKREGFVRECHGDLHLGNIVLIGDCPVPFDAVEFNPAFRWIDVVDEISFTMMDMLFHGLHALAWRFLNAYLEHTGDYSALQLLRLYVSYRAMVRAKVAAIRAAQPGIAQRNMGLIWKDCRKHLLLAEQILARGKPALIITHGLPGCGKSTFAQLALERFGAIRLRSDVERKRLFGLDAQEKSRDSTGRDLYTSEISRRTYGRLLELGEMLLREGYIVIIDAAFLKLEERERFHDLAVKTQAGFVIASITADPQDLRERLQHRQIRGQDASEADVAVLEQLQQSCQGLTISEQNFAVAFYNGAEGLAACASGWGELQNRLA